MIAYDYCMSDTTSSKISALNLDDLVWYIYIFISVAALYSNKLEKEYTLTHDKKKLTEFHSVNLVVLTIAFFIYIYFIFISFKRYNSNKNRDTLINAITSILFLTAGGISLYLELKSTDSEINDIGI